MERKGITCAGSMIVDYVKTIDKFPALGELANISDVRPSVGGLVSNCGIDLKKIDPTLPVGAIGCIGDDAAGEYLRREYEAAGIDTAGMKVRPGVPTGFTDVMSLPSGERTFFTAMGANGLFSPADIDLGSLKSRILHIGYILLLDAFDAADADCGTVLARFLAEARRTGMKISADVVSSANGDYPGKVRPVLPYCDYIIFNELECCRTWNLSPEKDGRPDLAAIRTAMELTLQAGVKEKVIVHCKEASFVLDRSGAFTCVPSLAIPAEEIRGSVGAGDAFCAGALYSLYQGWDDEALLEFASAAAACNLFAANAVDGMRSEEGIREIMARYPRRNFN